jgi:colicin import membrane protein
VRLTPTEAAPAPSTELATISAVQTIVPADFFKPDGSAEVLAALKSEVRSQAEKLDISTETGRGAIASLAYKVARSKTALDEQGKKLVADTKAAIQAIDKERGKVWDEIEALQKEVRKPLTDWENAERVRVIGHENALREMAACAETPRSHQVIDIELRIVELDEIWNGRNWEEFGKRATDMRNATRFILDGALRDAERAEAELIQAQRQAEEARERAIREREEAAARAAEEAANRRAEEQARLAREAAENERQRVENERFEAEAKARQAEAARIAAEEQAAREAELAERLLVEAEQRRQREIAEAEERRIQEEKRAAHELHEAEQRRAKEAAEAERRAEVARVEAESARIAAEQLAERRAREAAAQAERDRVAAVEAERKRVADEAERVRLETEKRERNKKHRKQVDDAASEAIQRECALIFDAADRVIEAISAGLIPNVTINY